MSPYRATGESDGGGSRRNTVEGDRRRATEGYDDDTSLKGSEPEEGKDKGREREKEREEERQYPVSLDMIVIDTHTGNWVAYSKVSLGRWREREKGEEGEGGRREERGARGGEGRKGTGEEGRVKRIEALTNPQTELLLYLYSINGRFLRSVYTNEHLSDMCITSDTKYLITCGQKKTVVVRNFNT
jgi:hypothetical protein